MDLGIIVAVAENGVIGKDGKLPWPKISEDFRRFKKLTKHHPVIMGRKTYESIGSPLSNRLNIILSRSGFKHEGVYVKNSLREAIDFLEKNQVKGFDYSKSYIIGGAGVYREALPFVNFMEITEVRGNYDGDVYFPKFNKDEWEKICYDFREGFSFVSYSGRIT